MVSGESLGKDSTLDERSGLDNFVLMLRPGWIRHQTDFVEARVSKNPTGSAKRVTAEEIRYLGLGPGGKWLDSSDYRRRTIHRALLGCGSSKFQP